MATQPAGKVRPAASAPVRAAASTGTRAAALTAALAAALLWGCAGETPFSASAPPGDRPPTRLAWNVFVVDDAQNMRLYDIEADAIVFDTTGGPVPRVGTLLVGSERGGFIRRAMRVETSGERLVVHTLPGVLTDAVISGWIDTALAFSAAPAGLPDRLISAGPGLSLDGISLLPPGYGPHGAAIVIERGRIEFDPELALRLTVAGRTLTSLEVEAGGPLALDLLVAAHFEGPVDFTGRTEIASFRRPLRASIGRLPVPLEVTLRFYAHLDAAGDFADDCRAGYSARHEIDAALSFDGAWDRAPVSAASLLEEPLFTCGDWTDCRIAVAVGVEIEVSFYAADRARFDLRPWIGIEVETEAPPFWNWSLSGGLAAETMFAAAMLDRGLPDLAPAGAGDTVRLAGGPFATPEYILAGEWGAGGVLSQPHGIAVGGGGEIYVVDQQRHRVVVFDGGGAVTSTWGGYGSQPGLFIYPVGVAVDRDGFVYVSDSGNHRIQKFSSAGAFLAAWGSEGSGPGQFIQPEGIAAGPDSLLAVCDSGTGSVTLLTTGGAQVGRWLNGFAHGAAFDAESNLFVAGCQATGVTKYSRAGELLERWEFDAAQAPRFDCPLDLATDPAGRIYVLEYGAGRFTLLSPAGETLASLGETGSAPGQFSRPGGIAVSPRGWVYVADTFNDRLQVFAPR